MRHFPKDITGETVRTPSYAVQSGQSVTKPDASKDIIGLVRDFEGRTNRIVQDLLKTEQKLKIAVEALEQIESGVEMTIDDAITVTSSMTGTMAEHISREALSKIQSL